MILLYVGVAWGAGDAADGRHRPHELRGGDHGGEGSDQAWVARPKSVQRLVQVVTIQNVKGFPRIKPPTIIIGKRVYHICIYTYTYIYIYIYIYEKGSLWCRDCWHILCWKSVFRLGETLHFKKNMLFLLRGNTTFQNKRSA